MKSGLPGRLRVRKGIEGRAAAHVLGTYLSPAKPFAESAARYIRPVERGPEAPGEGEGVAVAPEVHEEQAGLLVAEVVVKGGHLDSRLPQSLHHRRDLLGAEDEVAGRDRATGGGRLEVDRGGE